MKCKNGLRQGDPLSPFLFNLVADTLSQIFTKAEKEGYIKGLGNFHNKDIINLNFADDTLLFIKADYKMIETRKWIFIGFENWSGLKVNFTKSEIIPLNISEAEGIELAHILGCKIGKFPITYLGVPLSWSKLRNKDWDFLISLPK